MILINYTSSLSVCPTREYYQHSGFISPACYLLLDSIFFLSSLSPLYTGLISLASTVWAVPWTERFSNSISRTNWGRTQGPAGILQREGFPHFLPDSICNYILFDHLPVFQFSRVFTTQIFDMSRHIKCDDFMELYCIWLYLWCTALSRGSILHPRGVLATHEVKFPIYVFASELFAILEALRQVLFSPSCLHFQPVNSN